MSEIVNGKTGIYNHKNCIGRDFVGHRVLVVTMYKESSDYYETMVLSSVEENTHYDKVNVHCHYSKEEAVEGHIAEIAKQAYLY